MSTLQERRAAMVYAADVLGERGALGELSLFCFPSDCTKAIERMDRLQETYLSLVRVNKVNKEKFGPLVEALVSSVTKEATSGPSDSYWSVFQTSCCTAEKRSRDAENLLLQMTAEAGGITYDPNAAPSSASSPGSGTNPVDWIQKYGPEVAVGVVTIVVGTYLLRLFAGK